MISVLFGCQSHNGRRTPASFSLLLPLVVYMVLSLSVAVVTGSPIITREDNSNKKADKYIVKTLPGLDKLKEKGEAPVMHAGQLEIDHETDTNYFFWKFAKAEQSEDKRRPTIFWLNGGPGCSSMDGALMEVGPLRINEKVEVEFNNGSWYEAGDLIFVDQPGGTGFSYTDDYTTELSQVADYFLKFLKKFYEVFPEDADNDIYIAGESYAGQYIPYIAKAVSEYNAKKANEEMFYKLKGLLIGNGWIAPNEQSLTYIPYFLQAGLVTQQDSFYHDLLKRQEKCQNAIMKGETKAIRECDIILDVMLGYTRDKTAPEDQQCINMYDYTLRDSFPSCGMNWPPLLPVVNQFLRDKHNMELLNLKKQRQWNECDSSVSRYLKAKHSQQAIEYFPDLLSEYPIVLFNGDRDIICNYLGTEMMIDNLEWAGSRGFSDDVEAINWYYDDKNVGLVKSQDNLTFINVYNASHMVPFDNSVVSRGVFDIILGNFDNRKDGEGIETPIYSVVEKQKQEEPSSSPDNSGSNSGSDSDKVDEDFRISHSITFYIFEIVVVLIILYGIHYFYKYYNELSARRPTSILHQGNNNTTGGGNRKSKKVHWLDELDFENQQFITNTFTDTADGNENSTGKGNGLVNNLLNKFQTTYTKLPNASGNKHNVDIEMSGGEVDNGAGDNSGPARDEFIIESDEEEEEMGGDGHEHENQRS